MQEFVRAITILCLILIGAIIIRVILTWFRIRPGNPIVVVLGFITDPILDPLRRIMPKLEGLDLTPMVAILILWLIQWLLRFFVLE